jgi:hypothetical protein
MMNGQFRSVPDTGQAGLKPPRPEYFDHVAQLNREPHRLLARDHPKACGFMRYSGPARP